MKEMKKKDDRKRAQLCAIALTIAQESDVRGRRHNKKGQVEKETKKKYKSYFCQSNLR